MKLRPRVEILVVDSVTRSVFCGRWGDGSLALPGGGIEPGESVVEAAVRESAEECGFKVGNVVQLSVASEVEKWSDTYKSRLPADRREFDGSETRWCVVEFSRKIPNATLDTWNCSDKRFRSFEDAMSMPAPADKRFVDMDKKRKLALAEAQSMVTSLSVKTGFERFPIGGYAASDGYVRPWSIDVTRNRATAPNPYKPSKVPQPKVAAMVESKKKKSKNDDLVSGGDAVFKSLEQYMRKRGADGLQAGFLSRMLFNGLSGYQIKSAIERVASIDKQASDHLMRGFEQVWTKELFEKFAASNLGRSVSRALSPRMRTVWGPNTSGGSRPNPMGSQSDALAAYTNPRPSPTPTPASQPDLTPQSVAQPSPTPTPASQPDLTPQSVAQPVAQQARSNRAADEMNSRLDELAARDAASTAGSKLPGRGFMSRYGVPIGAGLAGAGGTGLAAYSASPSAASITRDLGIPLTEDGKVDYKKVMSNAMKDPETRSSMQGEMTGQFMEQVKPWLPYLLSFLVGAGGGGLLGGTSGAALGGVSLPLLLWLAQSNGLLGGGNGTPAPPADGTPAPTGGGSFLSDVSNGLNTGVQAAMRGWSAPTGGGTPAPTGGGTPAPTGGGTAPPRLPANR